MGIGIAELDSDWVFMDRIIVAMLYELIERSTKRSRIQAGARLA